MGPQRDRRAMLPLGGGARSLRWGSAGPARGGPGCADRWQGPRSPGPQRGGDCACLRAASITPASHTHPGGITQGSGFSPSLRPGLPGAHRNHKDLSHLSGSVHRQAGAAALSGPAAPPRQALPARVPSASASLSAPPEEPRAGDARRASACGGRRRRACGRRGPPALAGLRADGRRRAPAPGKLGATAARCVGGSSRLGFKPLQ